MTRSTAISPPWHSSTRMKDSYMCIINRARLVDLVCLVHLVHLVSFVQPNKQNKPNKLNKQEKPAGFALHEQRFTADTAG
jgi:hypothetical protein